MKKLLFFILFSISSSIICAQLPSKVEQNQLFGTDCYYLKQLPKSPIKGILVLIPGYGEHPYAVSAQTTIIQEAEKNGIAVMMVNLTPNNESLPIDSNAMIRLAKMIKYFYEQEKLADDIPLYLGGFSIGGTAALTFYHQKHTEFKINKIFAIDPPLDMVRLRKSLAKGREKGVIAKLDSINTNKSSPDNGLKTLSVYHPEFNIEALANFKLTALRIYCEPDILWWIRNRNMDLSDMNVSDAAGYINKLLQKNSNQRVELILTKGRGIRNGNQIHPHSWSIAEPVELISWLLKN